MRSSHPVWSIGAAPLCSCTNCTKSPSAILARCCPLVATDYANLLVLAHPGLQECGLRSCDPYPVLHLKLQPQLYSIWVPLRQSLPYSLLRGKHSTEAQAEVPLDTRGTAEIQCPCQSHHQTCSNRRPQCSYSLLRAP